MTHQHNDETSAPETPTFTSGAEVLSKINSIDYSLWQYTQDSHKAWHIGPMAQDFRKTFGIGHYDPEAADGWEYIESVDHIGVHGVAIQQLHEQIEKASQKVDELENRIQQIEKEKP